MKEACAEILAKGFRPLALTDARARSGFGAFERIGTLGFEDGDKT